VQYETDRQLEQWRETGETAAMGNKSNRGWDDVKEITLPQREKEEAHDYRYLPDPDLVPLTFEPAWVERLRMQMPELPMSRTERFIAEYHIPAQDAPALVDDRRTADLLDAAAAAGGDRVMLARHFLSFWAKHANERSASVAGLGISAARLAELANLVQSGKINATAAAQVAEVMLTGDESPAAIAERLGVVQSRDADQIGAWVDQALAANEQAVKDAIANPKKIKAARGFLTGQVMKLSGGKADPKIVGELIEHKLAQMSGAPQ
jgi:aspartyl-tRNA(Asn)/glutamyl-tRNA(Gln) amidotransferase subunit B